MSKDRQNIPCANLLMGSMRSMGYTFEAAIADIIDNTLVLIVRMCNCSFLQIHWKLWL